MHSFKKLCIHFVGCSSSSNLYLVRVIPSIQKVLISIGAIEFKNLQYTFKNLLQNYLQNARYIYKYIIILKYKIETMINIGVV